MKIMSPGMCCCIFGQIDSNASEEFAASIFREYHTTKKVQKLNNPRRNEATVILTLEN